MKVNGIHKQNIIDDLNFKIQTFHEQIQIKDEQLHTKDEKIKDLTENMYKTGS